MQEPRISKIHVEPRFIHQQTFLQRQLHARAWLSTEDLAVDRRSAFAHTGIRLKPGGKAGSMDLTLSPGPKGREDFFFFPSKRCEISEPSSVCMEPQTDQIRRAL